jgi:cell division protein FtsN
VAARKKRRSTRSKKQDEYPGWMWMIFGLAIGLSVAFAVYVKDREPEAVVAAQQQPEPASLRDALDDEALAANLPVAEGALPKRRFEFYDLLPAFEMIIADEEPAVDEDVEPEAIDEPGLYLLQAGSFSTHNDADRRRAELALHGIESRVQRAKVNGRDYYRVYVGPIDDLDELNVTRSRLRAAKIDVMRIRLGD